MFHHGIPRYVVRSTGVLTKESNTISAVVNIVNLDKYYPHHITIEVWDWSTYSTPIKLPVLVGENVEASFPYSLDSNNLAVFYADLDDTVDLYEIRISYNDHPNIIANCSGRSLPPYSSQEGNTVYHKQLVRIH
ncbi:hypothetical protein ACQVPL_14260 [Bacillus hominis]|jgi:hypothetical protein|uniref:hypothetical protein n=1 Tax=Bacillus hominis TaxID=2817478 RepID=UPI003D64A9DD